jgi:predicted  nucleic acid-binding Zn-ribbon protein
MDRESVEEIKRHFSVVSEGLRSEIRAVAEGLEATNDRIDRVESRLLHELGEMKSMMRLSFGEIDRRISGLEGEVATLRHRLDRLENMTPR